MFLGIGTVVDTAHQDAGGQRVKNGFPSHHSRNVLEQCWQRVMLQENAVGSPTEQAARLTFRYTRCDHQDLAGETRATGASQELCSLLSAETPLLEQRSLGAELDARSRVLSVNLIRALGGGYEGAKS